MALAEFDSVDLAALRWLRTGEDPATFALYSGDTAIETLAWVKNGGSLAQAETARARWTFKRAGLLNPRLTLRAEGQAVDTARVTIHHGPDDSRLGETYHRLDFATGSKFRFSRAGLDPPAWKVRRDDQVELAHIEPVREGRQLTGGAVIVSAEGTEEPELAAVLGFTWYFVVLSWFEDELLQPLEQALSSLERR